MLLSGENGVGKSALAGRWLRSLEPKAYFPVCITQASLTGIGVLAVFLQKLGKTPRHQRSINLKLLEEAFAELGRVIPVLLLDEAQNYDTSALEEVRMLLGLNLPEQPAFALILVGDSYLLSALRLRSHRALYSRIAAHVCIEKLKPSELEAYLEHQLRQVGIERPCFEPAALDLLASASEGIPRTINLLARAAWIEAAKEKALQISCRSSPERARTGSRSARNASKLFASMSELRRKLAPIGARTPRALLPVDRSDSHAALRSRSGSGMSSCAPALARRSSSA